MSLFRSSLLVTIERGALFVVLLFRTHPLYSELRLGDPLLFGEDAQFLFLLLFRTHPLYSELRLGDPLFFGEDAQFLFLKRFL